MKPILRNLISIVRRFKLAASLNILGLSVAFAAFMVIMIQLDYDESFDKCHKDYEKIFRVEAHTPQISTVAILSRGLADNFFESSPHIVAGAITEVSIGNDESVFYVETEGARNYFKENMTVVMPEFFDVFTFDFVEGSTDVYIAPGNVFLPLSLAQKIFGNESAVGKQIFDSSGAQTVMGVYRDFPKNTIIKNHMYFAMDPEENKGQWDNWNYHAYIRVNDASNASVIVENFMQNFDISLFGEGANFAELDFFVRLTPLSDIHFVTDVQYDFTPKSSRQTLMILFAIAIVIIAIAAINFTNFSTALTPMRVKSLNTQHVLGLQRSKLRFALVFEAVFICFVSYLVALLLVDLFKNTPLSRLVDGDLTYAANPLIFIGTALVAILAGFIAGVYPSRYMTSFEPAFVLKGSFALSPKGRKLRNTLIGIQYIASFALIIGASFMYLQNRFMQNSNFGYDRDNLVLAPIVKIQNSRDAFANQIKTYSGVEDVTFAQVPLSFSDVYSKWGRSYRGENIIFQAITVHHTFLKTMGIEIIEGRDFRQEDMNKENDVWIFNEAAQKQYGLEVNTSFEGDVGEIIGIMSDIKIASFRMAVEPMAFLVYRDGHRWNNPNVAYIKLQPGANLRDAISHINSTLKEFDADNIFELMFFDEVLQHLYEKETSLSSLITLFSILAIFISIVGVFGLVVFDSECRRKEIGIRKVLGASTLGIIIMFNKAYFKILLICFVIAAPLAWYAVTRWLENFAYKTPMYWWVYLMALVAVGVITACTVTFQNWRVANDDPVKSIKND